VSRGGVSLHLVPDLAWLVRLREPELAGAVGRLRRRLDGVGLRDVGDLVDDPRGGGRADAVVVWVDHPLPEAVPEVLTRAAVPVVLAGPTLDRADPDGSLAEAAGLVPGSPTARHDVRLRPGRDGAALADRLLDHTHRGSAHLGDHVHVAERVLRVDKAADDVEVLLSAQVGLTEHPMAAWRPSTGVLTWTLGTNPDVLEQRSTTRLLVLAIRTALGLPAPPPIRVGLLGYGAIGHEHSRAVRSVAGMELTAVGDAAPERLVAAREHAPGVSCHADGERLLADPSVDLVVVSTPPNSHAAWAMAALRSGKHVIVEKPFALRTEEADAVLDTAGQQGLLATVYQNRRFDPDHLAVRRAVRAGQIGRLFHLEAFVGGYGHPCNLWHSDAAVSGGVVYDWGAHVLDQILDLIPDAVEQVTAAEQKRMWLDVTNADHSRVTLRFAGGAEATFVYSDLAAALKPRWYVLGTLGAIVGHWRSERVVSRDDVGLLAEDVLAPADSPPLLDLHAADGSVTRLAAPPAPPYAFHAELADQLQLGLPMSVTGAQSRRVLAVMEAATASVASAGRPVQPRPAPSGAGTDGRGRRG
jgi:scyllo-inositol 2-dehydrogenase (NADP+)